MECANEWYVQTAWGSLFEAGGTKDGDIVVVHGATSSVGVWAVMLAKAHGCTVIGTTRQQGKVAKLKAAGADHVLIEELGGLEKMAEEVLAVAPKGVNTVLELVDPNSVMEFAFKILDFFGTVVTSGVLAKVWSMKEFTPVMIPHTRKMTMHAGPGRTDDIPKALSEMVLGIRDGKFKPDVFLEKVYPLSEIGKAHDEMEDNKVTGKVVVTIP